MSKQYTPEQQELFTKVGKEFNRLNMNGQKDTVEKINFKNGQLSIMKKDGKVMIEHKGTMKHFSNLGPLQEFMEKNLEYYMNKINGKIATKASANEELLKSNGIELKNGQVKKNQLVKAAHLIRNSKIQKAQATIRVDVDDKYKDLFNSVDKMKETLKFLEEAEKKLGCPVEWDCDAHCFWIHDDNMECNPEQLKGMLPAITEGAIAPKEDRWYWCAQWGDNGELDGYDHSLSELCKSMSKKLGFNVSTEDLIPDGEEYHVEKSHKGNDYVIRISGGTKEERNMFNLLRSDRVNSDRLEQELKKVKKSESAAKDEINKETLDKIKKDKGLIKAVNELPVLEKKVAKLKKEVPPIYNKILEKYDIKETTGKGGDGSRITDYDKLYKADNSFDATVKEFYDEANKELMKKYPGTKDGNCPLLSAEHEVVLKENEILELLSKYYSFVENIYKTEDRKQFLDIHKSLLAGAKAEVATADGSLSVDKLKVLAACLVDVQNLMKDGMYELNLAIKNKDLEAVLKNDKIKKLIEACNNAGTCEAAHIIWD
jgi:hypothetical protein